MAATPDDVEQPFGAPEPKSSMPRRRSTASSQTPSLKNRESTYRVERSDNWSIRSVDWMAIIRRQDHAGLLLLVIFFVATGVIYAVCEPTVNPFYIYDGTISFPPAAKRGFEATVPAWWVLRTRPTSVLLCRSYAEYDLRYAIARPDSVLSSQFSLTALLFRSPGRPSSSRC